MVRSGQDSAGQHSAGRGSTGQHKAVQDGTGGMAQAGWCSQGSAGRCRTGQDKRAQDITAHLAIRATTGRQHVCTARPTGGGASAQGGVACVEVGGASESGGGASAPGGVGGRCEYARVAACPIDPPGYDGGRGDPCLLDHSVRCAPLQLSLAGMRVPTSHVPTQPLLYIAGSSRPLSLGWVPPCRCTAPVSVRVVTHVWAVAPNPPSCVVPWTPLHTQPHVGWLWGAAACLR